MYYAGCDVSLKETFISIIDNEGNIVEEQCVPSDSYAFDQRQLEIPVTTIKSSTKK